MFQMIWEREFTQSDMEGVATHLRKEILNVLELPRISGKTWLQTTPPILILPSDRLVFLRTMQELNQP